MIARRVIPRPGVGLVRALLRSLPFAVAIIAIWFVWSLIASYGADLIKNREWVGRVEVPTLSALQGTVFERLVADGLIWTERRPGFVLLSRTSCTSATLAAPETAKMRGSPTKDQRRQLMDLLCRSPHGQFIQDEIDAWNLSYELLAVRDNRNVNVPVIRPAATAKRPSRKQRPVVDPSPAAQAVARRCATSDVIAHFFVPPHCFENAWKAVYVNGAVHADASTNPNAEPPLRDFAFLATEGITYPGDWRTFVPFADDRARGDQAAPVGYYELTADIAVGSEPVAIQVAGHVFDYDIRRPSESENWPRRLPTAGTLPQRLVPQTVRAAGLTVEIDLLCKSWLDTEDTKVCLKREENSAYQIRLSSPTRRSETVHVGFRVLPSLVPDEPRADDRPIPLHRATNIEAECEGPHPHLKQEAAGSPPKTGPCSLRWLEPNGREQRQSVQAQVHMRADGTSLIDPHGILTDPAFENGMAAIVGLGPTTYGSLAQGLAGARNLNSPVRLTIDPDLQRLTRDALSENISCNLRSRRGKSAACGEGGEDATRGTLVVMDAEAGPTGGEILAVATWPRLERGLGAWDLAALDAGLPSESPIAGNGWRAHDISAMAGSTFKPVTALAAVQRVLDSGDEVLSSILEGRRRLDDLERDLHIRRADNDWHEGPCREQPHAAGTGNVVITFNAQGQVVRCLGNARTETSIPTLLEGNIAAQRAFCGGVPANRLGVCEALAMSSNLYFGGLALYLDSPSQGAHSEPAGVQRNLAIVKMARRLFPDGLGDDAPANKHQQDFPLLRNVVKASRLGASPFILPAEAARDGERGPRQLDLALNGFGQAVTATPVAMATVYASLGSQTIIRPTLVRLDDAPRDRRGGLEGQPLLSIPPGREEKYKQLMTQIRLGLKGVVRVGTGACKSGHCWANLPPQVMDSIFAKTGTATLDKGERPYSAWMTGWVDPPQVIHSGITHRIAIACHIARTHDSGGTACAPIFGALVRKLHERR